MTKINSKSNTTEKPTHNKYPDILGGVILILGGVVLLLNNFGLVPWSIWEELFRFWPILLITGGLHLVAGENFISRSFADLIGLTLISLIFIYSVSKVNINFRIWANKNIPLFEKLYQIIPQRKSNVSIEENFYLDRRPRYSF